MKDSILSCFGSGPTTVRYLCDALASRGLYVEEPILRKHLKELIGSGRVRSEKEGRFVFYYLVG